MYDINNVVRMSNKPIWWNKWSINVLEVQEMVKRVDHCLNREDEAMTMLIIAKPHGLPSHWQKHVVFNGKNKYCNSVV